MQLLEAARAVAFGEASPENIAALRVAVIEADSMDWEQEEEYEAYKERDGDE